MSLRTIAYVQLAMSALTVLSHLSFKLEKCGTEVTLAVLMMNVGRILAHRRHSAQDISPLERLSSMESLSLFFRVSTEETRCSGIKTMEEWIQRQYRYEEEGLGVVTRQKQ